MKTDRTSAPKWPWLLAAVAFVIALWGAPPCRAQFPAFPPSTGDGSAGQPPYPGGFPGGGPGFGPPPGGQGGPPSALPDGVNRLYALQGTNEILAFATPDGYDRLLELIRNLDGSLDILRTKVVSIEVRTSDLAAVGITLAPNAAAYDSAQNAKLQALLEDGSLRPIETLRITTRENTPVSTLLRNPGARRTGGGTPFTVIPRKGKSGVLTLEILEPTATQVTVQSGQTAIVSLPGLTADTVRLLFLTPTVLPSASRSMR